MDLERGIEMLDDLEGMHRHCVGVLADLAGPGFLRGIRSAIRERELTDIQNRLSRLKLELGEACDREIAASGAYASSLTDTMTLAKRFAGLSARAAAVASACRNWRETEAEALIKDYAREIDGLNLETRIKLIDSIDDVEDSDTDVVRMSTHLRNCVSREGVRAVGKKLDELAVVLDHMKQAELDFAWTIRAQMVCGEVPDPSPGLVEVVGRITGKQVSYGRSISM
jgi:hypothetical protein